MRFMQVVLCVNSLYPILTALNSTMCEVLSFAYLFTCWSASFLSFFLLTFLHFFFFFFSFSDLIKKVSNAVEFEMFR